MRAASWTCVVPDCGKPARSRRLCNAHYLRWYKGKLDIDAPKVGKQFVPTSCSVPGCTREGGQRSGLCTLHRNRRSRSGDVGPVEPRHVRGKVQDGYRKVSIEGRWIAEHRIVMQEHLGRPLLPGENVHHINGDKLDNRPVNLELWSTKQPKGQRVVDKLAWAREIVALYQPLEDADLI